MVGYRTRAALALVVGAVLLTAGTAAGVTFSAYVAKKDWAIATVQFKNGYAAGVADAAIVINQFGRSGRDLNRIEQCTNGKGWGDLRKIADAKLTGKNDPKLSVAIVLLDALRDCR
jgi:hypothetical protein